MSLDQSTLILRIKGLELIKRINVQHLLPLQTKLSLYNRVTIPLFDYGFTVWGDRIKKTILIVQLQVLQNKSLEDVLGLPPRRLQLSHL